jgi:hypothetical protein
MPLPPLTIEQRQLGVKDVRCIHGNIHRVQCVGEPLLPFDCCGLCQRRLEPVNMEVVESKLALKIQSLEDWEREIDVFIATS